MPLVESDYYDFEEACRKIAVALPDEDPVDNLRQAAHSGQIETWVLEPEGRYFAIPESLWGASVPRGSNSIQFDQGVAKFRQPYQNPYSLDDIYIEGPIMVDKSGLDRLLARISALDVPNQGPQSQPLFQPTAAAETKCRKWLSDLMREGPPEKPKPQYLDEARNKFDVSIRGFDRAWGNAIEDTGNTDWSKPGPKS